MPRTNLYTAPTKPCGRCKGTIYYVNTHTCYGCVRLKAQMSMKAKTQYRTKEYFEDEPKEEEGEPVYRKGRVFDLGQTRFAAFKLAERIIMAGVDYS